MGAVNLIAVAVCGVVTVVLGGLWYSPVMFNKVWMRASGVTMDQAKGLKVPLAMLVTLVVGLISAYTFAMFMGPGVGAARGAGYGLCAGLVWIAGWLGVNYMWARRSATLFLIDGGHAAVQFTLFGAIIGVLQ